MASDGVYELFDDSLRSKHGISVTEGMLDLSSLSIAEQRTVFEKLDEFEEVGKFKPDASETRTDPPGK